MKEKINCWEFMKCGREPGGTNVKEQGSCPVTKETKLDGVHGGKNAGRSCWVVSGTFCDGKMAGTFAQKYATCETCSFYKQIKEEERLGFQLISTLRKKMGG